MVETSSTITALHLLTDWKRRILKDDYKESRELERLTNNSRVPKLLSGIGRRSVWKIGKLLGVDEHGVPGLACRLLESYLARQVHNCCTLDSEQWRQVKQDLLVRMPVLISACLQLAAKMSSTGNDVRPIMVRYRLLTCDINVTVKELVDAEYHVFSAIGFSVPLWTSVDVAQLLAMEVGIPHSLMGLLELRLDLVERHRDNVNAQMENHARRLGEDATHLYKAPVRTLHLCAGVVGAISKWFLEVQDQDLIMVQLSELTRAPVAFLDCVRDVTLMYIHIFHESEHMPRKRRRSESPVF